MPWPVDIAIKAASVIVDVRDGRRTRAARVLTGPQLIVRGSSTLSTVIARGPAPPFVDRARKDGRMVGALVTVGARADPAVDPDRCHPGPADGELFRITDIAGMLDSAAHGDGKPVVLGMARRSGPVDGAGDDEVLR